MLTGDLLRVTRRQGRVQPRLADPGDAALLERAAALGAEVNAHLGRRRGELERALDLLAPAGTEHGVERGLAKLLLDRCTFETRARADPVVLREALFDRSAAAWRREPLAEQPRWRAEALRDAGAAHGLSSAETEDAFYADLEANQALTAFDPITPQRLLLRYNVALVQGLLLRADRLEVRAPWPEPARVRQLFRWLKFFCQLFEVDRQPDGTLHLAVDGPLSVLEHAGRYGLNLAQFFAALLLWPVAWTLTARVRVGKRAQGAELRLEPHPWLKSPLPDHGAWVPEAVRDFVAAFNAQAGPWRAEPAKRIVMLPGNAYLVPDFEFVEAATGTRVLLEHVLYPAPERIARLLDLARQAEQGAQATALQAAPRPAQATALQGGQPLAQQPPPFRHYWIACKRTAGLTAGLPAGALEDGRLLAYRRALLASQVLKRLEEVALA